MGGAISARNPALWAGALPVGPRRISPCPAGGTRVREIGGRQSSDLILFSFRHDGDCLRRAMIDS